MRNLKITKQAFRGSHEKKFIYVYLHPIIFQHLKGNLRYKYCDFSNFINMNVISQLKCFFILFMKELFFFLF